MISGLKWKTGFGYPSAILFFVSFIFMIFLGGAIRIYSFVFALILGSWLVFKFVEWNGSPWRRVHFRGMLLYAACAGRENRLAREEKRAFDLMKACREMALMMCGSDKELNVDIMITELKNEESRYLIKLIKSNNLTLLKGNNPETRANLLGSFRFGPQLVIANIIENSYGSLEAANYAIALLKGKAR